MLTDELTLRCVGNITLNLINVNNYYVPILNSIPELPSWGVWGGRGLFVLIIDVSLCMGTPEKILNQNRDLQKCVSLNSSRGCAISMEMKREFNHV